MKLEINKEQAKLLWIVLNHSQHSAMRTIKELADDHASVRYAETEEDLKHITASWIHQTRVEYDMFTDMKEQCNKILFGEENKQ